MRIGVTGGSGFIGSSVVKHLLLNGHEVVVFDLIKPKRNDVEFCSTNILDLKCCLSNIKGIDVLYHLAAVADVNEAILNKSKLMDINVKGTTNVLEAVKHNSIPRIIYSSTEWVYSGLFQKEDIGEEISLDIKNMSHIYTVSKYIGEILCQNYSADTNNLKYTILRFGIPYGPGSREGTVFYNFIKNAMSGEPINIYGSGKQFRNFIYIDDLAAGCVAALTSQADNQVYNISGDTQITVKEIAQTIKSILGNHIEIKHIPARENDFLGTPVSINKAYKDLNWKPKISLINGLTNYLSWLNNNQENKKALHIYI